MKIHQLLSGLSLTVTNEENRFIESHRGLIKITSLDDRAQWIAQNLVRKGVYDMGKDNVTLIKKTK